MEHNAFEHLCLSLFKRGKDLFGMVTGYFDDSGTSTKDSVVVVAGYIGSVVQWQKFDREWGSLLSKYGVTVMHRADLESSWGEFVGWKPEKRKEFVKKAHQIIKRRTYVAIGTAVVKADFEELFPGILKRFYGGAYGFCAILCLSSAKAWFDKKHQKDPIDWVFEHGTEGSGQISLLFDAVSKNVKMRNDFKLGNWSFARKNVLPLQAADVIAYEVFKQVTNQIVAQPWRKVRLSLEDLVRSQDDQHIDYWTREALEEHLKSPAAQNLIKDLIAHNF